MKVRAWMVALLVAALGGCGSCKGSDASSADTDASAATVEPPVPAPADLVAEASVAAPDALWKTIQRGVGGAAAILPATFAGLVCAAAGLDPTLAFEVDGASPAFAVLADDGNRDAHASPRFVLAMKLADARKTQATFVDGDGAKYGSKDVGGGVRALVAKGLPLALAVGIARGGWLVVGGSDDDLAALAPYATRTMPTHPHGRGVEMVAKHDALAGPARARLARAWEDAKRDLLDKAATLRDEHAGRDPDFGDPPAIVAAIDSAAQRRLAWLGALDSAKLTLDATDDTIEATLTLVPTKGGEAEKAIASMHPGDTAPLRALAGETPIALLLRDDPAARADDATELAASIERVLGARLRPEDASALRTALVDWSKARGDWVSFHLGAKSPRALVVETPAADAAAATKSVREVALLGQRGAFADLLRARFDVRSISTGTKEVPGIGQVPLARLERAAPKPPPHAPKDAPPMPFESLGLAWHVDDGVLRAALGEEAAPSLAAEVRRPDASTLASDPRVAAALDALAADATFVLLAQPARVDPTHAAEAPAPVVVAWGRRDGAAWARLAVPAPLLRVLMHTFGGL